jgi:hypothetical protein
MLKEYFEDFAVGARGALRLYWNLVTAPFIAVYRVCSDFILYGDSSKSARDRGRAE